MRIIYTSQFKKDVKRTRRQGKSLSLLEEVIQMLVDNKPLEEKYRDHKLSGKWNEYRDCHIQPDWILIYRLTSDTLLLVRTGSHSELFQ